MTDRSDRTVWRLTAADLDDLAGYELSDDELERIANAIDHSTANESIEAAVAQIAREDDDRFPHSEPYAGPTTDSPDDCDIEPWGRDVNRDEWYCCKTHGYMVLGDGVFCEGYTPPPYRPLPEVPAG